MGKYVFLDTETTGLSPGNIAQLAMIINENNSLSAVNYFFEVDYITQGAEKACGRGVDFYKQASGGIRFKDKADEIYGILEGATIVCHNVKFDENFLSTEFWRLNRIYAPAGKFDTMEYFRDICKIPFKYASKHGKWKNPKLEEVVNFLNIDYDKVGLYTEQLFSIKDASLGLHDARYDTTAMFIAFQVQGEKVNGSSAGWVDKFCKR